MNKEESDLALRGLRRAEKLVETLKDISRQPPFQWSPENEAIASQAVSYLRANLHVLLPMRRAKTGRAQPTDTASTQALLDAERRRSSVTSVSALFSSNGSIDGGGGGGPSSGSAATTASPQKRPSTTATNTTTPATSSCSSLSSSNNQITVQPQPEHFYFKLTRTPDLILDPVSLQPLPFADVRSGDEFWCAPDHARDGVWITGNSLRVHRSFRFATNCIIVVNNYRSTSTTSSARSSRSSMDNNSINNNNNTDHLKTYIPPSPTPPVPTSSSTTSAVQNRINSHISSKASHVNPAIAAAAPISSSSRIHPTSSSSSSKTLARTLAAFNSVTSVSRATLGRSRLSGAELNLDIAESVTKQLVRITKDFTRPSSSSLRSLNEEDMALVPKPSPIPPSQATATDFINERDMIQLYGKIKEMITLEENFCEYMRLAVHKIYKAPKPKGIDEREIKKNFSIFEALHEHSKNVVEAFKASQTPGYVKMGGVELTPVFALASVFAQFVAEFKVFISYIQIQYWAQKWYMKYRNDKVHSDWFQTVFSDPDFKRQGMDFILMAPAQHVLRYSLTLNGIKGKIPESHRHFKIVEIALSFATALGKSCDEARTEEENYVNLFSIRSDEVENCPDDIISFSSRKFIKTFNAELEMQKRHFNSHPAQTSCVYPNARIDILSDMLLISVPNNNKKAAYPYYFKDRLLFSGMDIGSGPGGCGESERTATGPDLVLIYSEPSKESKTTQTTLFIRELKEGGGGSNGGPPLPKQPGEIEPIPALSDALSKYYLNSSGNVNLLERKGVA